MNRCILCGQEHADLHHSAMAALSESDNRTVGDLLSAKELMFNREISKLREDKRQMRRRHHHLQQALEDMYHVADDMGDEQAISFYKGVMARFEQLERRPEA